MDDRERAVRQRLKDDFPHYASRCLTIRDKDGSVDKRFVLNKAQMYLHECVEKQRRETGKVRVIILKGRQQGMSTYVEARFYWRVTHTRGYKAFILTHDSDATENLFEMANRYHDNCPSLVRPSVGKSNAKELFFDLLDSGYKIGTAGNKGVGRSSTLQLFHGSEVPLWKHAADHAKGIMQAIPNSPGTEVFLEATARGPSGYFYKQWQDAEAGKSEFIAVFIPWFWQDEYSVYVDAPLILTEQEEKLRKYFQLTDGQLAWRRIKIIELSVEGADGEKSFMQEYPCTPVEAFQTTGEDCYIEPDLVMRARKTKCEAYGHLVVGVDPARFGTDRTSIIRRQGRKVFGLESYAKLDTMKIVGLVHKIIIDESPTKVFIDIGGLGAGIYDRLVELGYKDIVVAVNSGESPLNGDLYKNKRAEMWGETKKFLQDAPCELPDSDTLHADLCAPKYDFDSKTKLIIESKKLMKKRGVRSPDEADALGLTFAFPIRTAVAKKSNRIVKGNFMSV